MYVCGIPLRRHPPRSMPPPMWPSTCCTGLAGRRPPRCLSAERHRHRHPMLVRAAETDDTGGPWPTGRSPANVDDMSALGVLAHTSTSVWWRRSRWSWTPSSSFSRRATPTGADPGREHPGDAEHAGARRILRRHVRLAVGAAPAWTRRRCGRSSPSVAAIRTGRASSTPSTAALRVPGPCEPSWDGRPARFRPARWHIECSNDRAGAPRDAFDVQAGGSDLSFRTTRERSHAHVLTGKWPSRGSTRMPGWSGWTARR